MCEVQQQKRRTCKSLLKCTQVELCTSASDIINKSSQRGNNVASRKIVLEFHDDNIH